MSQSYFYQPTHTYDPRLFGHPHEPSETQITEPFWHRYPPWAVPPSSLKKLQSNPLFNMDSQTTFIGSKTKNGQRFQEQAKGHVNQHQRKTNTKPQGKVDVYVSGEFIKEMPLSVLVRFSKIAAANFPKPVEALEAKEVEKSGKTGGEGDAKSTDWAEEDGTEKLDVDKLTAEVGKLKSPSQNETSAPTIVNGSGIMAIASSKPSEQANKQLDLAWVDLRVQPPRSGFEYAFEWMQKAKNARPGQPVTDYCVDDPHKLSAQRLVDMYAAALCLDLRPFPHKHRHALMTRITDERPLLAQLSYVHDHLPLTDPVVTRAITSCLQHNEHHRYSTVEWNMARNYVNYTDQGIYDRFVEIDTARQEIWQNRKQQKVQDSLQAAAESQDPNPVGKKDESHAGPSAGNEATAGKDSEHGGRRRDRRNQQRKGMDKQGKAVPGANY